MESFTNQTEYDLDHLDLHLPLRDDVQDLDIVKIQPRKLVLDHADYRAPARKNELLVDHSGTDQESIYPERSRS